MKTPDAARSHSFVWKPQIGGWGIVMCRHCRKHFKYRLMGFATEYPSTKGCHAKS